MAVLAPSRLFAFLSHVDSECHSRRVKRNQRFSATYADTISSQTFCGAPETMPGKPELQGGTRAVNSSLVMVQEVGWTRIDRS